MSAIIDVGDTALYTGLTIAEIELLTTAQIAAMTRQELLGYENEYVMLSPTVTISHRIEERSTANFSVWDASGAFSFEKGEEVIIQDEDGDRIFGGVVDTCRMSSVPGTSAIIHEIECADYHYLADKRLFSGAYEAATTAHDIVHDILTTLAEEGVTEGLISAGATLEKQAFPHQSCAEALDKLAELSGYTWFINEDCELYFIDRTSYPSAWNITDGTDILEGTITVSQGNPEYRNVQYIKGGSALTSSRTESFIGNGTVRSFPLGYPIATAPTVTLNAGAQTAGIKGVDTGKDWYWNKGDPIITQDSSGTVLESTDTLAVTYVGQYEILTKVSQTSEITNRQLIEGFGTGKVEKIATDNSILDQDAATEAAQGKLTHYAVIGRTLDYSTRTAGLAAGVLQTVTLSQFSIAAGDFLISAIEISFDAYGPIYAITAVEGPVDSSWEQVFCDLAAQRRQEDQVLSETATVQGLEEFTKTWLSSEHPNPFIKVVSTDSPTPAEDDFPSLETGDELSYCVLYTGGAEFFRKAITSQTIGASEITTICIILASEANGTAISHVGLWGGDGCTATAASGIEMEKHAYVKTKNALESLQLNFTDSKGW